LDTLSHSRRVRLSNALAYLKHAVVIERGSFAFRGRYWE
jgi:hypothetical protein